jgi:HAD superfamily phosphoserine phosphatase-like hydrolase
LDSINITDGIKGIIFDMDGTLIDSSQTWINADIELGRENNFVYTEEMFNICKTLKFMKACEYLSQFCNLTPEELAKRYYEILREKYADSPLTAGVTDLLKHCKRQGIKMCILTAGIKELVDSVLTKHKIGKYFEFAATADSLDYDKSDPAAFKKCAEKLGVKITETLVFEDSLKAAEAAKKAGAKVAAIYSKPNAPEHKRLEAISIRAVHDFTELQIQKPEARGQRTEY